MTSKTCPHCKKRKDLSQFGKRTVNKKTYLQSHCKSCRGIKNPKTKKYKIKAKKNNRQNKSKTGSTRKMLRKTVQARTRNKVKAKTPKKSMIIKQMQARADLLSLRLDRLLAQQGASPNV